MIRPARLIGGLAVAVPVLLIILGSTGALSVADIPGLPSTPAVTMWLLPVFKALRDIAAALTCGFLLVGAFIAPGRSLALLRYASISAVSWCLSVIGLSLLTVSDIMALPLSDVIRPASLMSFWSQTSIGQLMGAQVALTAFVALLGWAVLGRATSAIVMVLALVAAGLTGLTGHSSLHGGHIGASVSLALHLASVSLWIGGLVAICMYVVMQRSQGAVALRRYSTVALVCVIIAAETGLLNTTLRLESLSAVVTTSYGTIVVAKCVLLAWLVLLGWNQRKRVVASYDAEGGTAKLLGTYAGVETLVMGAALGLAVVLTSVAAPTAGSDGTAMTPGVAVALGIGLPLVLRNVVRLPQRWVSLIQSYPEPTAIALLLVSWAALSTAPINVLGPSLGATVSTLAIVAAGLTFTVATVGRRAWPAVALVMIGWPVITWWLMRGTVDQPYAAVAWMSLIACEALLVLPNVAVRPKVNIEQEVSV